MAIFDLLSKSEVKLFENNAQDSVRARALLEKTSYTPRSTLEFATIANKLIHEAMTSKNLEYKQSIEVFGSKMKKCFDTKGVYTKVAPDFLILSKNISSLLEDPDENFPPVAEYSSGEEEESDNDQSPPNGEESPDMSTFGEAPLAEPKRSFAPTSSSSSRPPTATPARTPSPRPQACGRRERTRSPRAQASEPRERLRSPQETRGEKSKKDAAKRSPSPASFVECVTSVAMDEDKPRIVHKSRSSTIKSEDRRSRSSTKSEIDHRNRSEERGADEERLFSRSQSTNKRGSQWTQLNYTVQKKVGGKQIHKILGLSIKAYFFS